MARSVVARHMREHVGEATWIDLGSISRDELLASEEDLSVIDSQAPLAASSDIVFSGWWKKFYPMDAWEKNLLLKHGLAPIISSETLAVSF